ncbi:hypothetical protein ACFWVC_21825 [Streptomyces sp. NPDC058691]|uniref:hypothetical protein n=1 Tax=Streptomyces sp. NPDC058691 TaxID=3346601 RepID=UPI003653F1FF
MRSVSSGWPRDRVGAQPHQPHHRGLGGLAHWTEAVLGQEVESHVAAGPGPFVVLFGEDGTDQDFSCRPCDYWAFRSRCRSLPLIATLGQRADCTHFKQVLDKIRVPKIGPGRHHKKPDSLMADKAYINGPCRPYLRRGGIWHTIPAKTGR